MVDMTPLVNVPEVVQLRVNSVRGENIVIAINDSTMTVVPSDQRRDPDGSVRTFPSTAADAGVPSGTAMVSKGRRPESSLVLPTMQNHIPGTKNIPACVPQGIGRIITGAVVQAFSLLIEQGRKYQDYTYPDEKTALQMIVPSITQQITDITQQGEKGILPWSFEELVEKVIRALEKVRTKRADKA